MQKKWKEKYKGITGRWKEGEKANKKKRMKKKKCKIKILSNDGFHIECESVLRGKVVI